MALLVMALILIWLAIGAVVAVWIYRDTVRKFGKAAIDWVVVGLLLSVIGAVLYSYASKQKMLHEKRYPPEAKYEAPKYEFEEKKAISPSVPPSEIPKKETTGEKKTEQIEGLPRCPHCGAAVSVHDWQCPKCGAKLKF
ncbi:MAG: hypothetical protein FJ151_04170 [Euryarchaeota archaeon]|nr:hypothetical protein [Euryarchaeota archaeon]